MIPTVAGARLATGADVESDVETVASLAFVLGILGLALVLVIFLFRQGIAVYRTRITAEQQAELRDLLTKATAAQERHAAAVEQAETRLADLSQRFTALERVLKEVE